jgi:hypothetical protein
VELAAERENDRETEARSMSDFRERAHFKYRTLSFDESCRYLGTSLKRRQVPLGLKGSDDSQQLRVLRYHLFVSCARGQCGGSDKHWSVGA